MIARSLKWRSEYLRLLYKNSCFLWVSCGIIYADRLNVCWQQEGKIKKELTDESRLVSIGLR